MATRSSRKASPAAELDARIAQLDARLERLEQLERRLAGTVEKLTDALEDAEDARLIREALEEQGDEPYIPLAEVERQLRLR
jgi:chaperonin cofactor prefoldin